MNTCIFGGLYGSEGKGSFAEWVATLQRSNTGRQKLIVAGENSPNSGHTCTMGKTRNIPASSFWADVVLMGPDSVIDREALAADIDLLRQKHGKNAPIILIHENAAWVPPDACSREREAGVVERISSTGSGSGYARMYKQFYRAANATIGRQYFNDKDLANMYGNNAVRIVTGSQYLAFVDANQSQDWLFECSQGALLDVNWSRFFPYVTARTTQPRVAIERNGLGQLVWSYVGVYRCHPIRTGGPSGPTGGKEITFADIGVPGEIASVTKRVRRVFEFDGEDFHLSMQVNRPDAFAFTHLDYLRIPPDDFAAFSAWLDDYYEITMVGNKRFYLSNQIGKFISHHNQPVYGNH